MKRMMTFSGKVKDLLAKLDIMLWELEWSDDDNG